MQYIKERPINLNLFAFSFPITAIVSILHRISGVILFIAVPLYMYLLEASLRNQSGFVNTVKCLNTNGMKIVTWCFLCALTYHFLAGLRHIIMDFGFAEEKNTAKHTAKGLLLISIVVFGLLGAWLW